MRSVVMSVSNWCFLFSSHQKFPGANTEWCICSLGLYGGNVALLIPPGQWFHGRSVLQFLEMCCFQPSDWTEGIIFWQGWVPSRLTPDMGLAVCGMACFPHVDARSSYSAEAKDVIVCEWKMRCGDDNWWCASPFSFSSRRFCSWFFVLLVCFGLIFFHPNNNWFLRGIMFKLQVEFWCDCTERAVIGALLIRGTSRELKALWRHSFP